ncbi:unnamed protein product [Rhodiola kirilowii]
MAELLVIIPHPGHGHIIATLEFTTPPPSRLPLLSRYHGHQSTVLRCRTLRRKALCF